MQLELSASFADDSNDGGEATEVQRSLQAEMGVAAGLGMEFQFDKMQVSPCAGSECTADLSWFESLGVGINTSQCIEIAKTPIGTPEFAAA